MAAITVRSLSDETKARLRLRAARNGRSTEAEVRAILDAAVREDESDQVGLGTRFTELFAGLDATEFEIEPRSGEPRSVAFD